MGPSVVGTVVTVEVVLSATVVTGLVSAVVPEVVVSDDAPDKSNDYIEPKIITWMIWAAGPFSCIFKC